MQRTNIYLDEEQVRALKYLAAEHDQSVAALVRKAVDAYIAQEFSDSDAWKRRLENLLQQVQERIPEDLDPEEIERDITLARDEVKQGRARRERKPSQSP